MLRIQFAQADQTKVREIGRPVRVASGQFLKPGNMIRCDERGPQQPILDKCQNQTSAAQVERTLGKHRFTSQQGFRDSSRDFQSPTVVAISSIPKSHYKPGVRDGPHFREKPLRVERFAGPSTAPANRRNFCLDELRARSNSNRTIWPRAIPDFRAVRSSHSASSRGSRMVSVLLTCIIVTHREADFPKLRYCPSVGTSAPLSTNGIPFSIQSGFGAPFR